MNNKLYVIILLFKMPTMTICAAEGEQQLAIISPFFDNQNAILTIRNVIDHIEDNGLDYPDYDGRRGSVWTDCLVETNSQPTILTECKETVKGSQAAKKFERRNPESIFNYHAVQKIFSEEILPKTLSIIKKKGWVDKFPPKIFTQLFVQRCHTSDPMDWHQDPGEDYDTMADFSLVLMLSNQDDSKHGWNGGEFNIRPGLPHEKTEAQTILHAENQGVLFNNKQNSHSVTKVTSDKEKSKRDLIVAALYLNKPPMPLAPFSDGD